MKRTQTVLDFITGIRFRLSIALALTVFISLMFAMALFRTKSSDQLPKLKKITEKTLKEFGPFTAKVLAGLYIRDFSTFDVIHTTFAMDTVVWFEFNPADISLSQVEKFSFIRGEIVYKSKPDIKLIGDRLFVMYQVRVNFRNDLGFHYFPFDAHEISILLTNHYVTPSEMILVTSKEGFNLSPLLSLSNWKIDELRTEYGYSSADIDTSHKERFTAFPEAMFVLSILPMGTKNHVIIFVPILFALLLALISLLVPFRFRGDNRSMRVLSSAGLTSLLAYRFVIESMIPKVGYLTTTDIIFTMALFMAFVPFLMQIFSFLILRSAEPKPVEVGHTIAARLTFISVSTFLALSASVVSIMYIVLLR